MLVTCDYATVLSRTTNCCAILTVVFTSGIHAHPNPLRKIDPLPYKWEFEEYHEVKASRSVFDKNNERDAFSDVMSVNSL